MAASALTVPLGLMGDTGGYPTVDVESLDASCFRVAKEKFIMDCVLGSLTECFCVSGITMPSWPSCTSVSSRSSLGLALGQSDCVSGMAVAQAEGCFEVPAKLTVAEEDEPRSFSERFRPDIPEKTDSVPV